MHFHMWQLGIATKSLSLLVAPPGSAMVTKFDTVNIVLFQTTSMTISTTFLFYFKKSFLKFISFQVKQVTEVSKQTRNDSKLRTIL